MNKFDQELLLIESELAVLDQKMAVLRVRKKELLSKESSIGLPVVDITPLSTEKNVS